MTQTPQLEWAAIQITLVIMTTERSQEVALTLGFHSLISATLKSIEQGVCAIAQFQRDDQASKIESAYEYLRQAERSAQSEYFQFHIRLF
jgi:hypothetical protein